MGHQIIQQPDGRLAVFSSIIEDWVFRDVTPQQLLDYYAERAAKEAREETQRAIDAVLAGHPEDVYYQFVLTFEEADEQAKATFSAGSPN